MSRASRYCSGLSLLAWALLSLASPAFAADPLIVELVPRRALRGGTIEVHVTGPHGVTAEKLPVVSLRNGSAPKDASWAAVDPSRVRIREFKPDAMTIEVTLPEAVGEGEWTAQLAIGAQVSPLGELRVIKGGSAVVLALVPLLLMLVASVLSASLLTGEQEERGKANPPARGAGAVTAFVRRTFNPLTLIETRDGKWRSYSLSKFQMLLWTLVVGGLFIYAFLVRRELLELPDSFLWLMGLSSLSTVGAKALDDRTPTVGDITTERTPNLTDLMAENGEFSLPRMQMLFWTLVLAAAVTKSTALTLTLPELSPNLLLMMGVSHGAYLFAKVALLRPATQAAESKSAVDTLTSTVAKVPQAVDLGVAGANAPVAVPAALAAAAGQQAKP